MTHAKAYEIGTIPMPNNELPGERIVIASVELTDEWWLVLNLRREPPFFELAEVNIVDGKVMPISKHMNIVPAVRDYEANGGEWAEE